MCVTFMAYHNRSHSYFQHSRLLLDPNRSHFTPGVRTSPPVRNAYGCVLVKKRQGPMHNQREFFMLVQSSGSAGNKSDTITESKSEVEPVRSPD